MPVRVVRIRPVKLRAAMACAFTSDTSMSTTKSGFNQLSECRGRQPGAARLFAGIDFGQATEERCAVNQLGTAAVIRVAIAQGIGDDAKRAQSTKHFNDGAQRFLVYFKNPSPRSRVFAVLDAENALGCGSFGLRVSATRVPSSPRSDPQWPRANPARRFWPTSPRKQFHIVRMGAKSQDQNRVPYSYHKSTI